MDRQYASRQLTTLSSRFRSIRYLDIRMQEYPARCSRSSLARETARSPLVFSLIDEASRTTLRKLTYERVIDMINVLHY